MGFLRVRGTAVLSALVFTAILSTPLAALPRGPWGWDWTMQPVEWTNPTVASIKGTISNDASSIYTLDTCTLTSAYCVVIGPEPALPFFTMDTPRGVSIPALAPGASWTGEIARLDFAELLAPLPAPYTYDLGLFLYAVGSQHINAGLAPTWGTSVMHEQFFTNGSTVPEPPGLLLAAAGAALSFLFPRFRHRY